ncbi:MAG: hypothetical protein QOJ98_2542 [Acidobacteriota bacterium]|jgi:hypothetical protein|nr:hypothetical protein [Acidobacteriota bacterium]
MNASLSLATGGHEVIHVLQRAAENAFFTVIHHPKAVRRFREALELFAEGLAAYEDVRGDAKDDPRFIPYDRAVTFFAEARRSLLCGAKLTFEHELTDAAKALRGAIEASFAGCHVYADSGAWERWANRPVASLCTDDRYGAAAARKTRLQIGSEFGVRRLANSLRPRSRDLAATGMNLYEELNDAGGHFNVTALQFATVDPESTELKKALSRVNRTAAASLRMLELILGGVWPDAELSRRIRAFTRRR